MSIFMNTSCHMLYSCGHQRTSESCNWSIWISNVTQINGSCHTHTFRIVDVRGAVSRGHQSAAAVNCSQTAIIRCSHPAQIPRFDPTRPYSWIVFWYCQVVIPSQPDNEIMYEIICCFCGRWFFWYYEFFDFLILSGRDVFIHTYIYMYICICIYINAYVFWYHQLEVHMYIFI